MKKKSLILLLLLVSAGFSAYVDFSDCGNASGNYGINLTANIVVGPASTLTNGACIYIASSTGNNNVSFNGFNITNNGSLATSAIFFEVSAAPSLNYFLGNTTISNFPIGILLGTKAPAATQQIFFANSSANITIRNSTYAVAVNGTFANVSRLNLTAVRPCNSSSLLYIGERDATATTFVITSNTAPSCQLVPTWTTNATIGGPQMFISNKIHSINGYFYNFSMNTTSTGINALMGAINLNYAFTNSGSAWYLQNPVIVLSGGTNAYPTTLTTLTNATFKHHYCVGGLCNPLYISQNSTSMNSTQVNITTGWPASLLAWANRVPINLTENQSLDRTWEPVEINLTNLNLANCTNEIRITRCTDAGCVNQTEIPSSVVSGAATWCDVQFSANVSYTGSFNATHAGANTTGFYAYYNNPAASAPNYTNPFTLSNFTNSTQVQGGTLISNANGDKFWLDADTGNFGGLYQETTAGTNYSNGGVWSWGPWQAAGTVNPAVQTQVANPIRALITHNGTNYLVNYTIFDGWDVIKASYFSTQASKLIFYSTSGAKYNFSTGNNTNWAFNKTSTFIGFVSNPASQYVNFSDNSGGADRYQSVNNAISYNGTLYFIAQPTAAAYANKVKMVINPLMAAQGANETNSSSSNITVIIPGGSIFPFYINIPDTLAAVNIANPYVWMKIWWKQGSAYYQVASSLNNEDIYFELQPNGVYNIEIFDGTNITNTTVINSCPNIYTVCQILVGGQGNYTIIPISNPSAIFSGVNYSISPRGAYWFANNTNISFTVASANGSLLLWGMQIDKYFNGTHSVLFSMNSTNATGGFLQATTNGVGRYVVTTFIRSTGFQTYYPLKQTYYVANATGFARISESLNSGTLINGWTWTLIALIVTAVVVGFISRYTIDGAAFVGIGVFTIFALLYPSAEVISGITIMTLDIIMAILALAMFALRQYY